MLDQLVVVAQSVVVENPVVVVEDRVVQVAAAGEIVLTQPLQVPHVAEGPRAADLLHEGGGGEVDVRGVRIVLEYGHVEPDRELDLEPVERPELRPLVPILHPHLPPDPQKPLGGGLLLDAGGLEEEHERPGAAVHDRDLGGAQVDVGVVDPEAGHRREQVLDGRDPDAPLRDEGGAKVRLPDVLDAGGDLHRLRQIDPAEHDPGIRRRGAQGEVDLLARMQPDSGRSDDVVECTLPDHEARPRPIFPRLARASRRFFTAPATPFIPTTLNGSPR